MSSFDKDGFLIRGMTCDVLKMSGKTPEIKDKLTICVIITNKTSKQDFNNSVEIRSRSHVLPGKFIINFLTSSAVASSEQVVRDLTVRHIIMNMNVVRKIHAYFFDFDHEKFRKRLRK